MMIDKIIRITDKVCCFCLRLRNEKKDVAEINMIGKRGRIVLSIISIGGDDVECMKAIKARYPTSDMLIAM